MADQYKDLSHTAAEVDQVIDDFAGHVADTVSHVTVLDRQNWDSKASAADLSNKVDKIIGKQLSTEDFTTEEKTKLAGLSNYDDSAVRGLIAGKADASDLTSETTAREAADTALQAAIDKKIPLGLGTLITDPDPDNGDYANLFTLDPGKYYRTTNPSVVQNLPAGFSGGFVCIVEATITQSSRKVITLFQASGSALNASTIYRNINGGNGYGTWYKFTGEAVQ